MFLVVFSAGGVVASGIPVVVVVLSLIDFSKDWSVAEWPMPTNGAAAGALRHWIFGTHQRLTLGYGVIFPEWMPLKLRVKQQAS